MAEKLAEKGIDHYCPLNKVRRQWSDRTKIVMEPVFKGYVFVKISETKKWDIKTVPGILNYVYWLGKPAVIKEEEIITIRKFLDEFYNVTVDSQPLVSQTAVRITQGIFMNYKGIVLEVFGSRAVVKLHTLDIQLSAQFDKKHLELITDHKL